MDEKVRELGWYILTRSPEFIRDKVRGLELHIWCSVMLVGKMKPEKAGKLIIAILLDARRKRARELAEEFSHALFGDASDDFLKGIQKDIRERRQLCAK